MKKEMVNVLSFRGSSLDDMYDGVQDMITRDVETAAVFVGEITKEQLEAITIEGKEIGFFSFVQDEHSKDKRNSLRLSAAFFGSARAESPMKQRFYVQELNRVSDILERWSGNTDIMPICDVKSSRIMIPSTPAVTS